MSKISWSLLKVIFFINIDLGKQRFYVYFLTTSVMKTLYFLKLCPIIVDSLYDFVHGQWKPNEGFFSSKSQTFVLRQTIWADQFWGNWAIFELFISTHFGTVSPLPMFSINHYFYKKLSLDIQIPNIIWDWDLNLGCKELGI